LNQKKKRRKKKKKKKDIFSSDAPKPKKEKAKCGVLHKPKPKIVHAGNFRLKELEWVFLSKYTKDMSLQEARAFAFIGAFNDMLEIKYVNACTPSEFFKYHILRDRAFAEANGTRSKDMKDTFFAADFSITPTEFFQIFSLEHHFHYHFYSKAEVRDFFLVLQAVDKEKQKIEALEETVPGTPSTLSRSTNSENSDRDDDHEIRLNIASFERLIEAYREECIKYRYKINFMLKKSELLKPLEKQCLIIFTKLFAWHQDQEKWSGDGAPQRSIDDSDIIRSDRVHSLEDMVAYIVDVSNEEQLRETKKSLGSNTTNKGSSSIVTVDAVWNFICDFYTVTCEKKNIPCNKEDVIGILELGTPKKKKAMNTRFNDIDKKLDDSLPLFHVGDVLCLYYFAEEYIKTECRQLPIYRPLRSVDFFRQDLMKSRYPDCHNKIFGLNAFIECLLKVTFLHLGFHANVFKKKTSYFKKFLWLIAHLRTTIAKKRDISTAWVLNAKEKQSVTGSSKFNEMCKNRENLLFNALQLTCHHEFFQQVCSESLGAEQSNMFGNSQFVPRRSNIIGRLSEIRALDGFQFDANAEKCSSSGQAAKMENSIFQALKDSSFEPPFPRLMRTTEWLDNPPLPVTRCQTCPKVNPECENCTNIQPHYDHPMSNFFCLP